VAREIAVAAAADLVFDVRLQHVGELTDVAALQLLQPLCRCGAMSA
jgi:hypothetical protein